MMRGGNDVGMAVCADLLELELSVSPSSDDTWYWPGVAAGVGGVLSEYVSRFLDMNRDYNLCFQ